MGIDCEVQILKALLSKARTVKDNEFEARYVKFNVNTEGLKAANDPVYAELID